MSEDTSATAEWLKNHPRMLGVLFTMMILLSEAGAVAAGDGGVTAGP